MKKQLLLVFAVFATTCAIAQSIPNGGFENWNNRIIENPQFFSCSNTDGGNGAVHPVNAVKTTDAYHGTYAIKVSTILSGGDTIGGFAANGNPGQVVTGGIPYAKKPTGFRFYYKSHIMPGDSALTLAIFKKSGNVIGQYIYKIGVSQANYTLFSATFAPALPQIPDTVVFGFAAGNLTVNSGIPGTTLQVDSISFTNVASQPANFNGDLELWQNDTLSSLPGWNGNGPIETTDKYSGLHALELQTAAPGFGDNQAAEQGNITNGIQTHTGTIGGSPYSAQIDTLVFYYKYLPANYPFSTDSASINVSFKNAGNFIGGIGKRLGYSGNYQKVEFPFNLNSAPDSMIINIQSSQYPTLSSYIGSDLKVDELYFKSQRVPVSDFIVPAKGCKGITIQLTDNSANMPTSWQWFMTGGSPANSTLQNPTVTYSPSTLPHTYTISLMAKDSFGSGSFISKTITIYGLPAVTSTSDTICLGNPAVLSASGAITYTWSNGIISATNAVSPSVTTTYSVIGTDVNGCSGSSIGVVLVPVVPAPDICLVTTDSTSTNNIIYWDKTSYTGVDSFIVYREVSTGLYNRIAAVSKDSLSEYMDVARNVGPANGNPNVGSYRYKLQIRDTCGNYGPLGYYHNTVYFNNNHTGTFTWNLYQVENLTNTPVTNFNLLRDDNNTGNWVTIGTVSGNQLSLNDANYSTFQSTANWRVEALGFNCTPTQRNSNTTNSTQSAKVKSKSNIANNRSMAIAKANNTSLNVYPNPSNGIYTLTLSVDKAMAEVYDLSGQKVADQALNGTTSQLNLSNLNNGVYFIQVSTANGVLHKKITKTN